jgi:tetratricopeptide (TPR) repeat protein
MKKNSILTRLSRLSVPSKSTIAIITTAAFVAVFIAATAYYYVATPAATVLVTTAEFPKELPTNFTSETLTNHVVANLQKMIQQAQTKDAGNDARLDGLGPKPAKETIIPIRALTNSPSPVFNVKWRGVDLNYCRKLGMGLRAKEYLELGVIGVPKGEGWRLTAFRKDWTYSSTNSAGSAPENGGACTDFESCVNDLTEQILGALDLRRLLNFYIKLKTPAAARHVLDLYPKMPKDSFEADDFVAWGNAFLALNRFDDALQKYQEALDKDPKSCSAHVARGFVYYTRSEVTQSQSDLSSAERDFRTGISCAPDNEYTRTSLCNTLLREWTDSKKPDSQILEEAKQQCEKALEINPHLVQASVNLAYVLYRQKKHEASLNLFEQLSQRYPTSGVLFLNYGYLEYLEYLTNKNEETLKRAAGHTLQAWNLDQKSDIAADNLGFFYYELGNYAQAVDFWNKAKILTPDDSDCLAGLALGTYKLGNRQDALGLLSKAIQMDPRYRDPAYLVANHDWSPRAAMDLTKLIAMIRT